jgi:hypothetical protein
MVNYKRVLKHAMARRSFLLKSALVSTISATLFDEFSSAYQSYNTTLSKVNHTETQPFVFVDTQGNIKLLTDMVDDDGSDEGIFAVSMAEDGWMEYLALQE